MTTAPTRAAAVIFDCDGTLVDSETIGNEVLVEFVAEFGLVMTADAALRRFPGGKMADAVASIEADLGRRLPDSFVPDLRVRMAAAFRDRLRPVDGADDLLRALTVPICVASNGPREKSELSLRLTGLLPYFDGRVFSAYDVGSWKPHPGLFLHAALSLNVGPAACVVVEDSAAGVHAAIAAGMRPIAFQPGLAIRGIPADVTVISRLADVLSFVDRGDRPHRSK